MRGTALCAAIEAQNYDITKLLLDAGCDVNAHDFDGEPPIFLAIRKALPVFHKKANASPALQLNAVETGSVSLVDLIVNHEKCNLNKVDPITKQTALHLSVSEKLETLVVMLMTSQSSIPCDVGIKNGEGETALHLAASTGNTGLLEALLQSDSCLSDVFTGCLQSFRCYPYNTAGLTALHVTCKHGQLASLKLLVERLKSLSAPNSSLDGALNGVSKRDNDVLAQNLNVSTRYERKTCLHLAAREGHVQIVGYLMQYQVDVDRCDAMGNSPLFLFLVSEAQWICADNSIPELLMRHGANPNKALLSFRGDAVLMQQFVGAIFDKGGDLVVERACKTVLHESFHNKNLLLMNAVLERIGIYDANRVCKDTNVLTMEDMFVEAVQCGWLPMVRVLLSHGVDIDTKKDETYRLVSCLKVALRARKTHVAKYLVDNGCSLELEKVVDIGVDMAALFSRRHHHKVLGRVSQVSHFSGGMLKMDCQIPRSLKLLCLCCIRKRLIANEVPFSKVHLLPLPLQLQKSIRYR
ncbi:hypothetical protein DPMN_173217 [Dreissena polymorpha]|uniref:SOCS box domain-containing protein n=2 Tax=Dreissena polymorpha TaxID=45954 RepID=A0A9D4IHD2_DREPO|nr:hypothetical protein DPMN_173217 [Dreissena polymorpha]